MTTTPTIQPFKNAAIGLLATLVIALAGTACESVRPDKVQRTIVLTAPNKHSGSQSKNLAELVQPFAAPKLDTSTWQWSMQPLDDLGAVEFHAPRSWDIVRSKAQSGDGYVTAKASISSAEKRKVDMAAYIAQVADTNPVYVLKMPSGKSAFITVREISVAPDNPQAAVTVYHTAIFDLGEKYGKFELRYDLKQKWRFETLANAIIGTMDVTGG